MNVPPGTEASRVDCANVVIGSVVSGENRVDLREHPEAGGGVVDVEGGGFDDRRGGHDEGVGSSMVVAIEEIVLDLADNQSGSTVAEGAGFHSDGSVPEARVELHDSDEFAEPVKGVGESKVGFPGQAGSVGRDVRDGDVTGSSLVEIAKALVPGDGVHNTRSDVSVGGLLIGSVVGSGNSSVVSCL